MGLRLSTVSQLVRILTIMVVEYTLMIAILQSRTVTYRTIVHIKVVAFLLECKMRTTAVSRGAPLAITQPIQKIKVMSMAEGLWLITARWK